MTHDQILNLGYLKVRTLSNGVTVALYPIMLFGCGRICFDIRPYGYESHADFESFDEASKIIEQEDDSLLIEKYVQMNKSFGES